MLVMPVWVGDWAVHHAPLPRAPLASCPLPSPANPAPAAASTAALAPHVCRAYAPSVVTMQRSAPTTSFPTSLAAVGAAHVVWRAPCTPCTGEGGEGAAGWPALPTYTPVLAPPLQPPPRAGRCRPHRAAHGLAVPATPSRGDADGSGAGGGCRGEAEVDGSDGGEGQGARDGSMGDVICLPGSPHSAEATRMVRGWGEPPAPCAGPCPGPGHGRVRMHTCIMHACALWGPAMATVPSGPCMRPACSSWLVPFCQPKGFRPSHVTRLAARCNRPPPPPR